MSLLMSPNVRRHKQQRVTHLTSFAYTSAAKLMDLTNFAEIRDYYIKEFASEYAMNSWRMTKGEKSKNDIPPTAVLYGTIPSASAEGRLQELLDTALFDGSGTYHGHASFAMKEQFKSYIWTEFEKLHNDESQTPYARVGAMMRLFLDAASKFDPSNLRLSHLSMRRWMTEHLAQLSCAELKKTPAAAAWPEPPSITLARVTATLNSKSPDAPLPIAFPQRQASAERSVSHRGTGFYNDYPKTADAFRYEAAVRSEILSPLTPGQHLMLGPWMENGFQMNAFSWRNFGNFLHRHYIMSATEETFDKSFFCEWVTFGGNNFSKPEYKDKYEALWDSAYTEWMEIAKVVIPNHPKLCTNARMTSLPPALRAEIAKESVVRWPGLAGDKEILNLLVDERERDSALDQHLTASANLVAIRDTLGFLNKSPDSVSSADRLDWEKTAADWSVHEHITIRNSAPTVNVTVGLPSEILFDDESPKR